MVIGARWDKPLPNIDPDTALQWEGYKRGEFLLWKCKGCDAWYWPKTFCRNHANSAYLENMEWTQASGMGSVFAFNVHHVAFHPGFKADLPYVYALIELEEGPLFGSNIVNCDPRTIFAGMPVRVAYNAIDEEYTLPFFEPMDG